MDIAEEQAARVGHKRILGKRILEEGLKACVEDTPELLFDYKRLK